MKSYDARGFYGDHKVAVTLQVEEYKGHVFYEIGGNCSGKTIIGFDFCDWNEEENDCNITQDEFDDSFTANLKNESGQLFLLSGDAEDFNNHIVKMEIVEYKEIRTKI